MGSLQSAYKMAASKAVYKPTSVQAAYVPMREVGSNFFSLYAPHAPGQRELRGVIEVSGMNYLLKSEEEQRLINDVFQGILLSLPHPLQILIRVVPLDLERYLAYFRVDPQISRLGALSEHGVLWLQLADSYVQFLQKLATKRTLLERRFYLIVPADSMLEESRTPLQQMFAIKSKRTMRTAQGELVQARQQLDLRCNELIRQLSAMGLSAHRLEKHALVALEYSTLTPKRAQNYPIHAGWIEGIDRLMVRTDESTPVPLVSSAPLGRENGGIGVPSLIEQLRAEEDEHRMQQHKRRFARKQGNQSEGPMYWPEVADLIAPAGILLNPDSLYIESEFVQTLEIFALPRAVSPGWFSQLATVDEPMEVSLFYVPMPTAKMMRSLKRRRFEMSTSNAVDEGVGRYPDPERLVAQNDIEDLMDRIASGQERMLEFSMHVLVRGATRRDLQERAARVRGVLHSMLLGVRPSLFEQDKGFRSCLPHARNELRRIENPITLASREASTTFPFLSHTLLSPRGILEGITQSDEPVILDWWGKEQRNANRLIVAPSGAGKSFKAKLDIIRLFLLYAKIVLDPAYVGKRMPLPFQSLIVDIEREYLRLVRMLGGQWIRFAPGSQHRLNPFDLPRTHPNSTQQIVGDDSLAEKVSQLQALLDVMLSEHGPTGGGRLSNLEKGLLDKALYETYRQVGISSDPRTHYRTPPLMRDLYRILEAGSCGSDTTGLAPRLRRFVTGSLAGMFAGQTNVALDNAIVCFDIHDLPKDLRGVALFLISTHVWNVSFGSTIPRQFVVDELASLYQYEEGKWFLETLFQRARKHYLSVVGITQYPKILLESTIPTNSAVSIVMAQELASLSLVQEVFKLSEPEVQLVRSFGKGEALLLTNDKRFAVRFEASELEYYYCTSDPTDIARFEQETQGEMNTSMTEFERREALSTVLVGRAPLEEDLSTAITDQMQPVSGEPSQKNSVLNGGGR